ncbi:MAG: response regulator transcription factor [Candidatus Omnitrophica bacterium]|nr:response regulator transcription factor [Candidatus Omnitrophota bacterium]
MSITVIIADDHALVREGIKAVLKRTTSDIDVIAEASDGKGLLDIAKKTFANVYLLDISMPLLNGLEVTARLMKMNSKNKVIILSMHDDRVSVENALKSGAKGYLVKETAPEEVAHAIREVVDGRFFLSPKIAGYIVKDFLGSRHNYGQRKQFSRLTPREKEILQLVGEGFTSKDIAGQLKAALSTVQVHRKNIMRKLDIHKQTDLVRFALKEGISKL